MYKLRLKLYVVIAPHDIEAPHLSAAHPKLYDFAVAPVFLDVVFPDVAVRAHELHGLVGNHDLHVRGVDLGDIGLRHDVMRILRAEFVGIVEDVRGDDVGAARRLKSDGHFGEHAGRDRVLPDGLVGDDALPRVFEDRVEDRLRVADGLGGAVDARDGEAAR